MLYVAIDQHAKQITVAIRKTVPEAIQSSDVDMLMNLEVFGMFPSIESVGRRFAFLHRVLRGEFPCFNSTIKALRLPAAHPCEHLWADR